MKLLRESEIDFEKYVLFYRVFLTPDFENRAHSHEIASLFWVWEAFWHACLFVFC